MNNEFSKILQTHAKRSEDTLQNFLNLSNDLSFTRNLFILSPTDQGVCRNGGRRGSCFGPDAIMAVCKKLAINKDPKLKIEKVSHQKDEKANFDAAQKDECQKIKSLLAQFQGKNIIHLGGGHDHIYPLASAIKSEIPLTIINIDAHLDTRDDPFSHSGTPFRQLLEENSNINLIQLGIHPFANASSNYQGFPAERMKVVHFDQIQPLSNLFLTQYLKKTLNIPSSNQVILSIDVDALSHDVMEGVSAVNHFGLSLSQLNTIVEFYLSIKQVNPKTIGFYEYNPLFDNLSQKGAKAIAQIIFSILNHTTCS